jgi:hypothetical protein
MVVCHNAKELEAAIRLVPEMERFHSDDYRDYLKLYSRAKWGLLNRVHGAFALASLGKPAAVVGSDTRARMIRVLGLPEVFVNDATEAWAERTISELRSSVATYPLKMAELKARAATGYLEQLRMALRAFAPNTN